MTPCQVSGFLDLISYLLIFFQAAENIVQKMLQNCKIWKISYPPPELSSCGSSEHVVDELSQNNGRTMQRSTNDEIRVQCYICIVSRCDHVCRTYIPTFTKSCEIFTAYFYVHEMTPCQVSGFLDLISYLLIFFQAARNIVQKMLQNGKIWKISYFPPELSSCGSSELVWYT